ncbi:MAG: M23 family metallopeptidase [candidate division Zixibacteria bacterium]|nr:M23 family metallopeptidase [candidate division Zixibacteria bacterium]
MRNRTLRETPASLKITSALWTALALLVIAPGTVSAVIESDLPVEVFVRTPPTPVKANGAVVLSYELHVTNFRAMDLSLEHVLVYDVADSVKPIARYPDDGPIAKVWHPGAPPAETEDPRIVHGGQRIVILFWLQVPQGRDVPRTLTHRLIFTIAEPKGGRVARMVEGGITPVVDRDLVPYAWPIHSGQWLEANGPSVNSDHRRAMHALDGRTFVAQRLALDLMKVGDDGRLWHTDPAKNENWYGYGQEVLAVDDGEVVQICDSIQENTPLSPTRAVRMTRANICGNFVVLKLREGEFVLLGHLKPGEITVKQGQRVKKGDVLGYIGNSGNSDAPHLHIHAIDGPAPLASEGIPYVFTEFTVLSSVKPEDLDGVLASGRLPVSDGKTLEVVHKREIPSGDEVIRIP